MTLIYCIPQTVHRINCIPTKEKTVAVDNGENGIVVATVIEKCQCYLECYRKSYYEKYREVASREEVVRIIHTQANINYIVALSYDLTFIINLVGNRCRSV